MAKENGLVTEAMAENEFWYSDGYADYIRHFLAGMGSCRSGRRLEKTTFYVLLPSSAK